ncbi:hypothetical protein [uncultured Duncaniella sp.]|uniref:hypothetical protein n=1 Tax=uncultured Duncaniella sp. TaxID=2768039 RepID=UPI0025A9FFBA|nr:hypothetical protein [uncultured Duncaniella sp.]
MQNSEEVSRAAGDYYWSQIGAFGNRLYTKVHVTSPADDNNSSEVADIVVSTQENLYVCCCLDLDGEVYCPSNIYDDWAVRLRGSDGLMRVRSPVSRNLQRIRSLCNILQMVAMRAVSVILFPDTTQLMQGPVLLSRLRIQTLSDLRSSGILDRDGLTLPNRELSAVEAILQTLSSNLQSEAVSKPVLSAPGIDTCSHCGFPLLSGNKCPVCHSIGG